MHHNSDTSTHPRRRNPLVVGAVTSSYRLPNYYLQTNATSESTSLNRLLLGLDSFQPDFAFLLGACFADPNHAASHRVERVFIQDDFDYLSAPQLESSAHPEPIVRGIKHKARLSFKFEDQAGTPFARASLRVATFGNRQRLPSQGSWRSICHLRSLIDASGLHCPSPRTNPRGKMEKYTPQTNLASASCLPVKRTPVQ